MLSVMIAAKMDIYVATIVIRIRATYERSIRRPVKTIRHAKTEIHPFSPWLQKLNQLSLVSTPEASSDIFPFLPDVNPIIDVGCPRSIGGLKPAVALCQAMEIEFELLTLDCDPFLHGYGKKRSKSLMTVCIRKLPVTDVNGIKTSISSYITRVDGFLFVGC